jgi:hypothetical protein
MPFYVDREGVPEVSKKRVLFVNPVGQSKNNLFDPED